jgi:hypothetical protein
VSGSTLSGDTSQTAVTSDCKAMSGKRNRFSMKSKARASVADFGRPGVIFDDEDIIRLLRLEIEKVGSQSAFARRVNVDRPNVNAMLSRRIPVSKAIADAIGLRRTYTTK